MQGPLIRLSPLAIGKNTLKMVSLTPSPLSVDVGDITGLLLGKLRSQIQQVLEHIKKRMPADITATQQKV